MSKHIAIAVVILLTSFLWLLNAEYKNEVPDYERPKIDYVKVFFNCVDKNMRLSGNRGMWNFYDKIDERLYRFLKILKTNAIPLSEFHQLTIQFRNQFFKFQTNYTRMAEKNCSNMLSYKNLNNTVNRVENFLGLMELIEQQQYEAFSRNNVLDCLHKYYNNVTFCTEIRIPKFFWPSYRPKEDPNANIPERDYCKMNPAHKNCTIKPIEIPDYARCGTSYVEMEQCARKQLAQCSSTDREAAVGLFKVLTRYSELVIRKKCYDLNVFLTFDVMLVKLRKIKSAN